VFMVKFFLSFFSLWHLSYLTPKIINLNGWNLPWKISS
jgi:hypothetical protein